jgi:hypothetical protein
MKCMQTNGYGLFNSPMLSKSIDVAYSDTKQHGKKHEKNYSHIKFYIRRNKKKKKTNKQTNNKTKKKRERYVKCLGR